MTSNEQNKNHESLDKAERSREEREARIKALKDQNSTKKRVVPKSHKKRNRLLGILAAIVAACVLLCYILWLTGLPQRTLTAMMIGPQKATAVEYNYAYYSTYNTYNQYFGNGGLLNLRDSSKAITQKDLSWGEFFHNQASESLKKQKVIYQKAIDAGITLTEEEKQAIEAKILQMQVSVGTPVDFEVYLSSYYGKGMTVAALRSILQEQAVTTKFASKAPESYTIDETKINESYETKKDDVDLVDYHVFTLSTETKDKEGKALSAEDLAKAVEANKAKADSLLKELKSGDDMLTVAKANAADSDKKTYEEKGDATKKTNVLKSQLTQNNEVTSWLFDAGRKAGDKTVIKNGNNFILLYFDGRSKDTRKVSDFIMTSFSLLDASGNAVSEETKTQAKKLASAMVSRFKSEQDFLDEDAKAASAELPKPTASVKYEKASAKIASRINQDVVNYALSSEAKVNEAKLIETSNALYVVMVLDKADEESWHAQLREEKQTEAYNAEVVQWTEDEANQIKKVYPAAWLTA